MHEFIPAKLFLLPNRSKIVGGIFLLIGIVLAIVRFYFGIKPEFLHITVFSIYSKFLGTKFLSLIANNIFEEIVLLLILLGLFMVAFSKEKDEDEQVKMIRLSSMYLSVFINTLGLALSFFFIFGLAFAEVMVLNLFSVLIIYLIIFRFKYYLFQKKGSTF